jgi:hypothetical protein
MIFKNIFAKKIGEKKLAFLTHTTKPILKMDNYFGFWENAKIFAENGWISQKIVIIASTPGRPDEFVKKLPKMYCQN